MRPLIDAADPPEEYVKPEWQCVICGARPVALVWEHEGRSNAVKCSVCHFPYTVGTVLRTPRHDLVPKPAYGIRWQEVWCRAWRYYEKGRLAREFVEQFASWESANNTMNRLDGGRLAREPASEDEGR